ncbi:hypothetical protein H6P81_008232 [Aristolochia fimbriata]|uniref:Uncharacterized protein n=1 Tax=Aristolochia fimbriata TaxID=158543 RepID=A0AAV7F6Z3_ARIFI|nr:hypothetical protein H6P81_008232 [Aristolochia fimbriata]
MARLGNVVVVVFLVCTMLGVSHCVPECCKNYDIGRCDPVSAHDHEVCDNFCRMGCSYGGTCSANAYRQICGCAGAVHGPGACKDGKSSSTKVP